MEAVDIRAAVSGQIRARRLALGLTQDELARAVGCSCPMIGLFESGCVPRGSRVLGRVIDTLHELEHAGLVVPFRPRQSASDTWGPEAA
jgi:predicted transcriptional regulator